MINEMEFISETTPIDKIVANFKKIAVIEVKLKQEIRNIMNDDFLQSEISKGSPASSWTYILKEAVSPLTIVHTDCGGSEPI